MLVLTFPAQFDACVSEGQRGKLAHRVLHTSGDDKVFGTFLLQDEPHALHVVAGVAPVALRGQITQQEHLLHALGNAGRGQRNLAGHESLAAPLALVIEEDARAAIHAVCLAILLHYPIAIELCHSIGRIGVEGRVLVLRHLLHLAVELARGGLVDATRLAQPASTHSFEHTQNAHCIHIGSELGRIERHLYMTLGCQVIYLVGAHQCHHLDDGHGVGEVGIVEMEVWPSLQMSDAFAIVHTRAANDAMHLVALLQQQFAQERAVLPGDTCD